MALNVAQLMTTPNGTGAITNYPGAVKSGAGVSVSTTDGAINLIPPTGTNLGGVRTTAGTGISIDPNTGIISATGSGIASVSAGEGINVSGTTNVTISQRPATQSQIGGIKPGTGVNVATDGTLTINGYLPLTGGKISATGEVFNQYPGTLLIQTAESGGEGTNSRAPLMLLKGPGNFAGDTGTNGTFMFACYDPADDVGCAIRIYDPSPGDVGTDDTSISNQLTINDDNLWVWASRQLRFNSSLNGSNLFSFFQYGSGPRGGRLVSYISNTGQYIIQNGAVGGASYYSPPVALTGNALDQINALTPQAWTYAIQPVDTETNQPEGPVVPSDTMIGFTPDDVELNCPAAFVPDAGVDGSATMGGGVNYNAIFVTAVQAIQELSQQLDTLQQQFDNYVATHP